VRAHVVGRDRVRPSLSRRKPRGHDRTAPHVPCVATILQLQREAGNQAVAGLLDSGSMELGQLISQGERLMQEALQHGEGITENRLTDELFWFEHPRLQGQKLRPGTPQALRWQQIRNVVVRPRLRPSAEGGHKASKAAGGTTTPPVGLVPADEIAAESTEGESAKTRGASKAGTADKYFTQDVGHYRDIGVEGKPRVWLYGSSGANVCNMTSLTMGLVSLAGESQVREKLIGFLQSGGAHAGASVKVGRNWVSLVEALANPKIAARIETIDLATAVAIGKHGGYGDVTLAGTIARVARMTGLATAKVATGPVHLTNPKARESAAKMLAEGTRVIAGTVNHYVYLIEIQAEGAMVHDPAGARVTPGLTSPIFLHAGDVSKIAHEFFRMDAERRATALRRVSTNAEASVVVDELSRLTEKSKADRTAALRELTRAHPGHISTGALNFYANSEFAANDLRLRVTLSAAKT
jgi:hypothetical protein